MKRAFFVLFTAASMTTAGMGTATPAKAQDGYSGLIAPAEKSPAVPKAAPDGGYSGLIAPEPGYVEPAPAAAAPPEAATPVETMAQQPAQTPAPGPITRYGQTPDPKAIPPLRIVDSKTLSIFANLQKYGITMKTLPPELAAQVKISPRTYSLISSKQPRMEGLLPIEFAIKRSIDRVMKDINDPNLTPDQRRQKVEAGYERLLLQADGMTTRKSVPDEMYGLAGVPAIFVKEEREATDNSLERLRAALQILRNMR